MRLRTRLVVLLYPRAWRTRYGDELDALIEDSGDGWGAVLDVAKGALAMRMPHWRAAALLGAITGALMGAAVYLSTPALYASSATIRVSGASFATPESPASQSLRAALAKAVPPLEQRTVTAVTLRDRTADSAVMTITYETTTAASAQRVVTAITTAFLEKAGAPSSTLVEAATLPGAPARRRAAPAIPMGAGLGLVVGTLAAGLSRARRDRRAPRV